MKAFTRHKGLVAPLDRANVDTDMIIPKQFLKSIKRTGFGPNLFDELRYLDQGEPGQDCLNRPINPDFPLNKARYKGASILLTRKNFGCGSSREHAPWALEDYGFNVIVAPSYADIFYNNCFKNGILPVKVTKDQLDLLMENAERGANATVTVDLENRLIKDSDGVEFDFEIDEFKRHCLLNGLDDVGLTMQIDDKIGDFEGNQRSGQPWLYAAE